MSGLASNAFAASMSWSVSFGDCCDGSHLPFRHPPPKEVIRRAIDQWLDAAGEPVQDETEEQR
jgi:hypothetical protein